MSAAQKNPGGSRRKSRGVYTTRRLVAALVVLFVLVLVTTRACQAFVGSEQDVGSGEDIGSGAPKKAAEGDTGGGTKDASPDGKATDRKSEAGSEDAPEGKTPKGKGGAGQDDGATENLADVLTESLAGKVAGSGMTSNEEGVAASGPSASSADRTPQISVVLVASKGQPDAGSPVVEDQDELAGQDGTGPSSRAAPAPPAPAPPPTTAPVSTAPAPAGSAATPPAPAASSTAAPIAGAPVASQRRGWAQGRGNRVAIAPVVARPKFGGVRVREQVTTAPAPVRPVAPAPVKPVAPATIGAPVNNGRAFPGVGAVHRGVTPVANNVGVGGRIATTSLPGG
jgi:hypothetical protein